MGKTWKWLHYIDNHDPDGPVLDVAVVAVSIRVRIFIVGTGVQQQQIGRKRRTHGFWVIMIQRTLGELLGDTVLHFPDDAAAGAQSQRQQRDQN